MTEQLKVGVLGTGSLGKEHARLYASLAAGGQVSFAGVYDASAEVARRIAQRHGVTVFASVEDAAKACDAFSIVTPTTTHYALARTLLQDGKHLLVEKPMTDNAAQASELVELARAKGCVLQVGHVERFNP